MEELNVKKTKYFVIAIIILIILGVLLIIHFNNKEMVNGENKENDKTVEVKPTDEVVTTTKKRVVIKEVSNEVKEEVIYKSVIDDENKLVYNYKLTNEITESDKLISKKMEISDLLKEKNIIGLYDISLYDVNLVKKSVNNSLITIKMPLTDELKGYEDYKIVYINDNNEISSEVFESKVSEDYIEFNTTHLSMFGIIGTKKIEAEDKVVVDLSKATIDVKVNGEVVNNVTNILLKKDDKVELVVNNISENVEVYYGLRPTGMENFEYQKYDGTVNLDNGINYTLFVKVLYGENNRLFEVGKIGLYDVVYEYDKNAELKGNVIIGELNSDKNNNLNVVIDNVNEEVKKEASAVTSEGVINNNELNSNVTTTNSEKQNISNNSATITINGNIYLVEETDISELKMTGYLYIDTEENIIFNKDANGIVLDGLYNLTIRSKVFTLNGNKYTYEYKDEGIVIYQIATTDGEIVQDKTLGYPIISTEVFNGLFSGNYEIILNKEESNLIIGKVDETSKGTDNNNVSLESGENENYNSGENVTTNPEETTKE